MGIPLALIVMIRMPVCIPERRTLPTMASIRIAVGGQTTIRTATERMPKTMGVQTVTTPMHRFNPAATKNKTLVNLRQRKPRQAADAAVLPQRELATDCWGCSCSV